MHSSSLTAVRIFIVEDHPIFRKGLIQLISAENDFDVCGEAEEYIEAMAKIKKVKPDFLIVDISLKNSSGIELIKDVKALFHDILILALSMHDENIYAERVLRSGARGYLMKQEAPETVISAVRQILSGRVYVSENIASRMLNQIADGKKEGGGSPVDTLTDRELEVFKMIGEGFSTRQIADRLHISIKTVENHRAHIKEKMNLDNAIELIQRATLWVQKGE
jgi:DNA-binding NarL/FixJ family response regulator